MVNNNHSEQSYASPTQPGEISPTHSHGVLSTIAEETDTLETLAGSPTASQVSNRLAPPTMARQETLETSPRQRSEHAAELLDILGNAHAHLNKQSVKEQLDPDKDELQPIFWEQYSSHAQVELDLELESNVAVQGDCFRGHILINVNPKEPLLVAAELGKIRLLGLQWLSKDDERSVFYSFSSSLLLAAPGIRSLLTSESDEEGFCTISMGSFSIPFSIQIPPSSDYGHPKGRFSQQGASVRSIILVTLRLKYPVSRKQSIAHFFRECVLWPRVDPQRVLHVATRPIQVTTSEDDIHLTASLYPPTWVAGQECRIKVVVSNNAQNPVKHLDIGLFNTITVFHRPPCQPGKETESMTTQLSKVSLKVKQPPTPGHASAKGWWSGVKPGETRTLYHLIPIPPDALSVSKGHLFEVTTFMRVLLPRGVLLTNISVDLPFVIVNAHSFRRPESGSRPLSAVPDLAASHTMNMNALRQDRDNLSKSVSKIHLADNDQETPANNCSGVNEDQSINTSLETSFQPPHPSNPLHFSPKKVDKMPPPYLTNFSRRVEEKRQQLIKLRSLQADEIYDAELLEDLDFTTEYLASTSPTRYQGESRNPSDSQDPEIQATTSRSPSPDPDEPIQTRDSEHGLMAIVPGTYAAQSDDNSDCKGSKETPGREQAVDGPNPMMTLLMSPKRTGSDRDAFKCAQPSMPAFTSAPPKFLTSNGAASVTNSLKVSSSFPSSGSIPKLGAVKERIKALEMRTAA